MCPQSVPHTSLKLRWQKERRMFWEMRWYPKTVQFHSNLYMGGRYRSEERCIVLQYQYSTDCWRELPEYDYYWFGMCQVNGHLTLVGGRDRYTHNYTNKLGVWDPSSQQWTQPYPPMITPRYFPEVATYNNYLLAAGGDDGRRMLTTVEVLDVMASKQWLSAKQLPIPCQLKTSAILHDHWYIITASKQVMCTSLPELCNVSQTVTKSATTNAPARWMRLCDTPLEHTTAVAVHGSLLTVGGYHCTANTAIYLYHPETNKWTKVGDLPTPRYYCSVALLSSNEILVLGGSAESLYNTTTSVDIATIMD